MTTKTPSKPAKKPAKKAPAQAAKAPAKRKTLPKDERQARFERWQAWSQAPGAIEELCNFIANNGVHGSLSAWCRDHDFPFMTVQWWIEGDAERSRMYERARQVRADAIADAIVAVAYEPPERTLQGSVDSGSVQDKRVRIDTLKWAAGKLAPKRYGDKVQLGGAEDLPPIQQQVSGQLTISPSEAYRKLIGG
jgi:hypothetical protein